MKRKNIRKITIILLLMLISIIVYLLILNLGYIVNKVSSVPTGKTDIINIDTIQKNPKIQENITEKLEKKTEKNTEENTVTNNNVDKNKSNNISDDRDNFEVSDDNSEWNNKTIKIVIILILIMAIVTGSVFIFKNHNKHERICSFPQFQAASQIVSERMGINDLWDVTEFKDICYFETNDVIQYSTNIYLHDAFLSLFFYNKGEEVYSYICDVEPSDLSKAESLLKCITRCVCNNYFTIFIYQS